MQRSTSRRKRPLIIVLLPIIIGIITVAITYFSGEEQTVPVTGREQRVGMSDQQQMALGAEVFQQTLMEVRAKIVDSGPEYDMVRNVAQRIAAQGAKDKPDFEWQVVLIDEAQANAFCLPGGKIVVYTGLLQVAETEAQLAAVVGHEVAHATAEHGAERIFREELTNTAVQMAAGAVAGGDPQQMQQIAGLLGAGAQVGFSLPWSRSQESEADVIGLIYMARAGYNPEEAVTLWENMERATQGQRQPEYLSTHPDPQNRIAEIQEWLPRALEEYQEAR